MKEMCCPICGHLTAHPADAEVVKCANCFRSFQLEPKSSQQQSAREAWSQLDRATLTHHNLDGDKSEQGIAIILSHIERAWSDGYVAGSNYQLTIHAQPQHSEQSIEDRIWSAIVEKTGDMELADEVTKAGKDTPSNFDLLRPEKVKENE